MQHQTDTRHHCGKAGGAEGVGEEGVLKALSPPSVGDARWEGISGSCVLLQQLAG